MPSEASIHHAADANENQAFIKVESMQRHPGQSWLRGGVIKKMVAAAFIEKLARHLLLLACLAILSKAAGWTDASQIAILLLTVLATAVHICGRLLRGAAETVYSHDP